MRKDVKVVTDAEIIKVWIDGTQMKLTNGKGQASVTAGVHHAISWAARGAPGTKYSIKITAPAEAKLERGDTFDEGKLDVAMAWFSVNEDE